MVRLTQKIPSSLSELGDLGVDVFGGLIMEPPAGSVALEAVEAAPGYGYGPGTAACLFHCRPTTDAISRPWKDAQGADLLSVPTNWVPMPDQPEDMPVMANILAMSAAHSNSLFMPPPIASARNANSSSSVAA